MKKRVRDVLLLLLVFTGGILTGILIYERNHRETVQSVAAEVISVPTPEPVDMEPLRMQIEETLAEISGEWSVYVKHLDSGSVLEYQNCQMQPASVIKLFRMAAFYRALHEGLITADPEILGQVERMIVYSENAASNEVVAYIGNGDFYAGAEYVSETAVQLGCIATQDGMMLFDYDPGYLIPGTNYSCVTDCGIILEKIYRKECISPEYDEAMLNLLLGQTRREKIPALLPEGTKIANKTGETDDIQADVGIVFSPNGDYIICAMVNNTWSSLDSQQAIARLSEMTYRYFNENGTEKQ